MNKKLGIMGGTFDPIHVGHLMIAESVREALSLDEVLFIPSNNPRTRIKQTFQKTLSVWKWSDWQQQIIHISQQRILK